MSGEDVKAGALALEVEYELDALAVKATRLTEAMRGLSRERDEAREALSNFDTQLTAVRLALTKAGIPTSEAYRPEEGVSEWEQSLRSGGVMIPHDERVMRLAAQRDNAYDVIAMYEARFKQQRDYIDHLRAGIQHYRDKWSPGCGRCPGTCICPVCEWEREDAKRRESGDER